jgi:hypothetical protein
MKNDVPNINKNTGKMKKKTGMISLIVIMISFTMKAVASNMRSQSNILSQLSSITKVQMTRLHSALMNSRWKIESETSRVARVYVVKSATLVKFWKYSEYFCVLFDKKSCFLSISS